MISEKKFGAVTMQDGRVAYKTEKINGFLEALIISSSQQVSISIVLEDSGIVLFKDVQFSGVQFIALRMHAMDYRKDLFNYSHEKWALNDRLVVTVEGAKNTRVNFVLRYTK